MDDIKDKLPEQDRDKMMDTQMKMMAVNKNHAFLKNLVGEWDVKTKAWMEPGGEPTESHSFSSAEMIMGGRFLRANFKGMMFGQPFEGLQIVGFDNHKEKIISLWIDSSSTTFFLTEGTLDLDNSTITEEGTWPDPMTGGVIEVKAITTLIGQDEYTYQMYMTGPDGNEFKSMENQYLRKE